MNVRTPVSPQSLFRLDDLLHAQRLPSGSAKKTKRPLGKSWISETATPRPSSASRAASMSETTSCRPSIDPGAISLSPLPIALGAAEPGGVSWTKRISSLIRWSWSKVKPTCSA